MAALKAFYPFPEVRLHFYCLSASPREMFLVLLPCTYLLFSSFFNCLFFAFVAFSIFIFVSLFPYFFHTEQRCWSRLDTGVPFPFYIFDLFIIRIVFNSNWTLSFLAFVFLILFFIHSTLLFWNCLNLDIINIHERNFLSNIYVSRINNLICGKKFETKNFYLWIVFL